MSAMRCAQYLLYSINFVFGLLGTFLVGTGAMILIKYSHYDIFLDYHHLKPAQLLISVGIAITAVSFLGGFASITRSYYTINVYALVLSVITLLEFFSSIVIFSIRGAIYENMQDNMFESLKSYNSTDEWMQKVWDQTQLSWNCCGVKYPTDWINIEINGPQITWDKKTFTVPYSCCSDWQCLEIKSLSCSDILGEYVSSVALLLGILMIFVQICQMGALVCAIVLSRLIKRFKMREVSERRLQNQALFEQICPDRRRNVAVTSVLDLPPTYEECSENHNNK